MSREHKECPFCGGNKVQPYRESPTIRCAECEDCYAKSGWVTRIPGEESEAWDARVLAEWDKRVA